MKGLLLPLLVVLFLSVGSCAGLTKRLVKVNLEAFIDLLNDAEFHYVPDNQSMEQITFPSDHSSPRQPTDCKADPENQNNFIFTLPKDKPNVEDWVSFVVEKQLKSRVDEHARRDRPFRSDWTIEFFRSTAQYISHCNGKEEDRRTISKSFNEFIGYFYNSVELSKEGNFIKPATPASSPISVYKNIVLSELFPYNRRSREYFFSSYVFIPSTSGNVAQFVAEKVDAVNAGEKEKRTFKQLVALVFDSLLPQSTPGSIKVEFELLAKEIFKFHSAFESTSKDSSIDWRNLFSYLKASPREGLVDGESSSQWLDLIYRDIVLPVPPKVYSSDFDAVADYFSFVTIKSYYYNRIFASLEKKGQNENVVDVRLPFYWDMAMEKETAYEYEASMICNSGSVTSISIDKKELARIIEESLKKSRFVIFLRLNETVLPPAGSPFAIQLKNGIINYESLIQVQFPLLRDDDPASDTQLLTRYILFVKSKLDANKTREAVKEELFSLLWNKQTFQEFEQGAPKSMELVGEQLNMNIPFASGLKFVSESTASKEHFSFTFDGGNGGGRNNSSKNPAALIFLLSFGISLVAIFSAFFIFLRVKRNNNHQNIGQ